MEMWLSNRKIADYHRRR